MPDIRKGRIEAGTGEVTFSGSPDTAGVLRLTGVDTSAQSITYVRSVSGLNLGPGRGIFAGANGTTDVVLEFKSLVAGNGIDLIETPDAIMINVVGAGDGGEVIRNFRGLSDTPNEIVPNALLMGLDPEMLGWTPAPTVANTVLRWTGSGFVWAPYAPGVNIDIRGENGVRATGGPITSVGTFVVGLNPSGVISGQYVAPTVNIDPQGRITSAVSNTLGEVNTAVNVGTGLGESFARKVGPVLNFRRIKGTGSITTSTLNDDVIVHSDATVSSVSATGVNGIVVTGSPITTSGTFVIGLADNGVTPGTYSTVVVNSKGLVTSGSNEDDIAERYRFRNSTATLEATGTTVTINTSGALVAPNGTDAQRPTASSATGGIRFNTTFNRFEFSDGINWVDLGSLNRAGTNRLYVAKDGSDSADGRSPSAPLRTIKRACQRVSELIAGGAFEQNRVTIFVASGTYIEDCPITVPAGTSIIGDNLRSVTVRPAVPTSDVFLMNSACYCWGLSVRGHQLSPSALDITPDGYLGASGANTSMSVNQTGFAFRFAPGAQIIVSPYVQNCSSFSGSGTYGQPDFVPGGGGLLVDPSVCAPGNLVNSFVIDAFTQLNLGGIGVKVMNKGYVQLVSFFVNFCQFGVLAVDGGHATLLNSNATFGHYALWAHGGRTLDNPVTPEFPIDHPDRLFGSLIEASGYTLSYAGSGLDYTKLSRSQGGTGESNPNCYTVLTTNDPTYQPRIFNTVTDERGDFYVGPVAPATGVNDLPRPAFRISQSRGVIDGRSFYQSIFGFMAPFTLALTRKN